jgi:hypothetical protein
VIIANNRGIPSGDKMAMGSRLGQTMDVVEEAFVCAYESRSGCVFFDEKMARLDYNLYKLALLVLVNAETKALFAYIQKELVPQIPVVTPAVEAAAAAGKAATETATVATQVVDVVDSLVRLGYNAVETLGPLLPLYRDAQELDMKVVLDMLARKCVANLKPVTVALTMKPFAQTLDDYFDHNPAPATTPCIDFKDAVAIYKWGNGDLGQWRQFTKEMNVKYISDMTPTSDHFVAVSSAFLSGCEQMFSANGTSKVGTTAYPMCSDMVLYGNRKDKSPDLVAAEKTAKNISYSLREAKPVGLKTNVPAADKSPKPEG